MHKLLAIGITLVGTIAHAEPNAYVGAGGSAGVDGAIDWIYSGWSLDAGYRVEPTLWLHANVSMVGRSGYGTTNDLTLMSPKPEWYAARLGLETHRCRTGALCIYAGIDGGFRTGNLDGWIIVPRLGLDVGGDALRFRAGAELLVSHVSRGDDDGAFLPDAGLGMTASVVYQW